MRILTLLSSPSFMSSYDYSRSRDWVCPRCNRSNLECLPDPAQSNDSSTSGSVSEVQTSSEAEVVPTPAEAIALQSSQTEALVSEREANPDRAEGAGRMESDNTTSVVTSPHSSASSVTTSSQNVSGSRQAGPAPFRPSHPARPPMLLDTAICVLLVLVFALLCRRVF